MAGNHEVIVTDHGGKRQIVSQGSKVTKGGVAKALRPGQSGEVRLSALLPIDAMLKAGK